MQRRHSSSSRRRRRKWRKRRIMGRGREGGKRQSPKELRDKLGHRNLVHRTWGCESQSQRLAYLCFQVTSLEH